MSADSNKASREHLGALLIRRRVEMDRGYRNRRVFAEKRGISYHLVYNVETGRQAKFETATVAVIEAAWDLEPGAVERALAGGPLVLPESGGRPLEAAPPADPLLAEFVPLWRHLTDREKHSHIALAQSQVSEYPEPRSGAQGI